MLKKATLFPFSLTCALDRSENIPSKYIVEFLKWRRGRSEEKKWIYLIKLFLLSWRFSTKGGDV